jgi:hypothetical protein
MYTESNFKNNTKLIISWVLLLSLIIVAVFQFSTTQTNAQQANPNRVRVTCAPTKPEVMIDEQVTFVAAVINASSTVRFSWKGPEIKSENKNRVKVKYSTNGTKKATVTARVNGESYQATCSVVVKSDAKQQPQLNPEDLIKQLQGLLQGQQGGQTGGLPGGQQGTGTPGQTGSQPTQGGSTPTQQTQAQRETAAQQRAVQEYNRKQQQAERTFEQEKKKCEEGDAAQGGNMADNIQSSFQDQTTEEMGQLVPTDPKPIVDPIKNIRENIERLTAKEIGLKDSEEPALDQKVACKVDAGVKKLAEQSRNFLEKGRDGNTQWLRDTNGLVKDSHDIGTKIFINALANTQSCKSETNKKIAEVLASSPRSIIAAEPTNEVCKMEENKDLNKLETYLNYSSAIENPSYLLTEKYSGMLGYRTEVLDLATYENEVNGGFLAPKDEEGKATNHPDIYKGVALFNINNEAGTIAGKDEAGEDASDLYADFLSKAGLDSITGIEERTANPNDSAV